MIMRAIVGIGGNIKPRLQKLRQAVDAMRKSRHWKMLEVSPVYETDPWGYEDQKPFLNAAVVLETPLSPQGLLRELQTIEQALGRRRNDEGPEWGPREIDLDILLIEETVVDRLA